MKRSVFRRATALLLIVLLLVCAAPVSFAADDSDVAAFMRYFESSIQKPKTSSVLDEPVKMTVRARNSDYIYVYASPDGLAFTTVPEGSEVIVYAKQNGYVLGLVENTVIGGWMSEKRMVESDSPVPDVYFFKPVPEPEPETVNGLSSDELSNLAGKTVRLPKGTEILEKAEIRYVESTWGYCIYSLTAPYGAILTTVNEGTKVTVYARRNGYSLAQTDDGSIFGWMADQFLEPVSRDGIPNPADTADLPEGISRPVKGEYLDLYRPMYVRSTYGTRVYIVANPSPFPDERFVIGYANEQEACTPVARRNGFLFVITESGQRGWVATEYLVYEY